MAETMLAEITRKMGQIIFSHFSCLAGSSCYHCRFLCFHSFHDQQQAEGSKLALFVATEVIPSPLSSSFSVRVAEGRNRTQSLCGISLKQLLSSTSPPESRPDGPAGVGHASGSV